MRYLIDTDWVIDYQRGVPRLVDRLDALLPQGAGLSIVSLAELYEGIFGSAAPQQNERRLRTFLDSVGNCSAG